MRTFPGIVAALALLLTVPAAASGQASIVGVVKDESGAVLPGVTVEASSPSLVAKTRTAVSDGSGQYRIVDLPPGTYDMTFTLTGFKSVKRESVELAESSTAIVNAKLRVGEIYDEGGFPTAPPTVETQSATRRNVIDHIVIDAIPTGGLPMDLAMLITGVTDAGSGGFNSMTPQDVGGASRDQHVALSVHGSRGDDQRMTLNRMSIGASNAGMWSPYSPSAGGTQEIQIDTGAVSADATEGGVWIDVTPKAGNNRFRGTLVAGFASDSLASSNLTDDLRARGLAVANSIRKVADVNPGFGGPIKRDTLWFYASYRAHIADNWAGGMFDDPTARNPNVWSFNPDNTRPVSNDATSKSGDVRLTWQANRRNRVAFSFAKERQCMCASFLSATESTGINNTWGDPHHLVVVDGSSLATNRLFIEGGFLQQYTHWGWSPLDGLSPNIIGFTEQSTGIVSKVGWLPQFSDHWQRDVRYRAALSYVNGAHVVKVGISNGTGDADTLHYNGTVYGGGIPLDYRFNGGVPNLVTLHTTPFHDLWSLDHQLGIFAQDQWSGNRLTVTGGLRVDYQRAHFPAQTLGPALLAPTRNLTIPETPNVSWKDITPRLGAVLDVFGDGKTAVKISLNKYVGGASGSALGDPVTNLVTTTTRAWIDANRNFVPDCELTNPATNGECFAMADASFGKTVPGTTYDPAVLSGWGARFNNWEFSLGAQHEILPRVAVEISYFRRWYGNFLATDDLALAASDFNTFSIPAPADSRLPGGGTYGIDGLHNLNPSRFGAASNNFVTFASGYGNQIEHWHGVDVSVNARPSSGILLQAGVSTGRTSTDNCAVVSQLPELLASAVSATPQSYCHVETPFLVHVKGLSAYTIPVVDVQVSGVFQSIPGPQISASYNALNVVVSPSLGRPLSGGSPNVTVNLIAPGTLYGERANQLDLRVAKILKFGRSRTALSVDLYNALNSSAVAAESSAYAIWRTPQTILAGRFAKIGAQFDF